MHKIDAEQVLSARARVDSGKEKGQLTLAFFLWLAASVTITVATGVFLWNKDTDVTCVAPNSYGKRDASY